MKEEKNVSYEVSLGEPLVNGGYFVAYNYVVRNVISVFELSPGEFSCLMMLFSYAGADKTKCFPSQDSLLKNLDASKRTVQRYLTGLEEKGVLTTYHRFNKESMQTKNIYDLSPCLNKIRELYAPKEENEITIVPKKPRENGDDKSVAPEKSIAASESPEKSSKNVESMGATKLSPPKNQGRQECRPTNNNNNKHIKPLKNKKIDDDIANSVSLSENESEILQVINELRKMTKDELTARSFNTLLRKVSDKRKQGKIKIGFRDYFVSALANKIEELENRRIKENAKKALENTRPKRIPYTGKIAFYDWLNS